MGIWGSFKFSYIGGRGGGREEARGMGGGVGGGRIIEDVSVQL